jgi:hypothetical protein
MLDIFGAQSKKRNYAWSTIFTFSEYVKVMEQSPAGNAVGGQPGKWQPEESPTTSRTLGEMESEIRTGS